MNPAANKLWFGCFSFTFSKQMWKLCVKEYLLYERINEETLRWRCTVCSLHTILMSGISFLTIYYSLHGKNGPVKFMVRLLCLALNQYSDWQLLTSLPVWSVFLWGEQSTSFWKMRHQFYQIQSTIRKYILYNIRISSFVNIRINRIHCRPGSR